MTSLAYFLVLTALSAGQEPAGKAGGAPASPQRQIALVYTINSFGNTEPVGCPHKILHDGGLARRLTCLRQLAAAGRPVLLVDGGSTFFPEVYKPQEDEKEKLFMKGELIAEAMNRMGYQAMAVGTTDLLLGLGETLHMAGRVKFPLLSANFVLPQGTTGPGFKPYTVIEVGGLKVGVIGLLLETMGKAYLAKVAPGSQILPSIPAARKAMEELSGKVDLVVVLSHERQDINRQLAKEVAGINVILDPSIEYGNHHPRIKDEEWLEMQGDTVIARADGNGSSLGVLEIDFNRRGAGLASRVQLQEAEAKEAEGKASDSERAALVELRAKNLFSLRRIPLSPHYADDPEAVALLDAHRNGGDVQKVPSKPAPAARADFLTASACESCHQKQYDNWKKTRHFNAIASVHASGADRQPECISCHTTGYGLAFVDPAEAETFNGVQCEACHGTRPEHPKSPANHRFGAVSESICLPCHNEDVLKKDFSFGAAVRKVQCPAGK